MRPVHLEFSGLRSYRGQASIDFSTYDLFAIIGDTGAGKSTIIEALSLALYAKKTWSGGASLKELIADGQNTMTIRLRFASGGDEWEVTRTRHRNASAPVDRLVGLTTGEQVDNATPVTNRIAEIVGLTHEQFTRAVVMPQGRFDELLTAKASERNEILRSIFGLDELERVRELAHAERTAWTEVRATHAGIRGQLPADPDAELADVRERLVAARAAESTAGVALAEADEATTHLAGRSSVERLARALAAVPDDLGPAVADLEHAGERGEALLAERAAATEDQARAAARISELSSRQTEVLAGFADRDAAITATSDLREAIGMVARAALRRDELDEAEASLGEPVDPAAALAPFEDAVASADATLRAATEARDEAHAQARAVAEASRRLDELATALADADGELAATEAKQADTETARLAAADHERWATDELARCDAEVAALKERHVVADLAHGHGPGDPCPVCRRPLDDEFDPPTSPDLDEAIEACRQARRQRLEAEQALRDAETEARVAASAAEKARAARRRTADEHRRQVVVLAELDAPDVDQADAACLAAESDRLAAVDARSARAAEVARVQDARSAQVAAIEAGRREIDAELVAVRSLVDALPPAWSASIGRIVGDVTQPTVEALETTRTSIGRIVDDVAEVGRMFEAARSDEHRAAARIAAITAEAADTVTAPATAALGRVREHLQAVTAIGELVVEIDDSAAIAQLPTVPERTGAAQLAETVQLVEQARLESREILSVATTLAEARRAQLAAWEARLAGVLATVGAASVEALRSLVAETGRTVAVLDRDQSIAASRLEQAVAADAVLAIVGPLVANLTAVEEALRHRDGRFIDHLVGERERELLAEASRRLKTISNGRHGFVADFGVANIASGEVRPPDALSGGERFQAALALALALVEIASRGGGHLDAVFVDEGFGSLDAAALDAALETLGGVAGGGKMVGLISHLRPVAEYVDTVLHVTKDDTEGSRIRPLDPEAREQLLDDEVRSGLTT